MSGCPQCYVNSTEPLWLAQLVARHMTGWCDAHKPAEQEQGDV